MRKFARENAAAPPSEPTASDAFRTLLAPLPASVQTTLRASVGFGAPPTDVAALFRQVEGRSVSAGIAEGRGGYPGGDAPGWAEYVADQRAELAAFDALVTAYGAPATGATAYFESVRESLPTDAWLAGETSARVESIAGRVFLTLEPLGGPGSRRYTFPLRQDAREAACGDPAFLARLVAAVREETGRRDAAGQPRFSELDFVALEERLLGERVSPS